MTFQLKAYVCQQLIDAYTCPLNRNGTREEHKCDDWELYKHPEWLIEHYIKCGGMEHWRKRRKEFEDESNREAVGAVQSAGS